MSKQVAVLWKWEVLGGHVHVGVFSATAPGQTWARNGKLCFSLAEWSQVLIALPRAWQLCMKNETVLPDFGAM